MILNLSTKKATCDGVFRNHLGIVLFSFAVDHGFCSINYAELWVMYIGIDSAWSKGFKEFTIKSDSKVAIDLIRKLQCTPLIKSVVLLNFQIGGSF